MNFITTAEASKKWGISTRRITTLCNEGRVEGAECIGRTWFIPLDATKPCTQKRGPKADNQYKSTF